MNRSTSASASPSSPVRGERMAAPEGHVLPRPVVRGSVRKTGSAERLSAAEAARPQGDACCRRSYTAAPTPPAPRPWRPRLAEMPQYRHPFVEGCTCGSGVMGCCPCSVGLAEQGALAAGGRPGSGHAAGSVAHGPLMAVAGLLGAAGLILGVRAITTNREASVRVRRALAQTAEQRTWLAAQRHRLVDQQRLSNLPATLWRLGQRLGAAERRQQGFVTSLSERTFNIWVPGVVQVVGSACILVATGQHFLGGAIRAPFVGALAAGILAGYAGLYAARAVWRAADAWQHFLAARRFQAEQPQDAFRAAARKQARAQALQRTALAATWVGLAVTSTAVVALPLLGMAVGQTLALSTCAAQVGAVATSIAWPAPVHTPAAARLDEAYAMGALAQPQLRAAWLDAVAAQVALLRRTAQSLLQNGRRGPFGRRVAHWLEPWTTPQCGPRAFRAVAQAFEDGRQRTDGPQKTAAGQSDWPAVLTQAVADYVRQELVWLDAAQAAQAAYLAAAEEEFARLTANDAAYMRSSLAEMLRQDGQIFAQVEARRDALRGLADTWQGLAEGQPSCPHRRRSLLRRAQLDTLVATGLVGEVAGGAVAKHPEWFYAAPAPERLAFGHVVLRPEAQDKLLDFLGDDLDFSFVRCLLNPNRLVAEREELLAARVPPAHEQSLAEAQGLAAITGAVPLPNNLAAPAQTLPWTGAGGMDGCSSCAAG